MRRFGILFCAATVIAAVACNKVEQESRVNESELIPMTFTATTSDTRTVLDADQVSINWLSTDLISVFDRERNNNQFETTGAGRTVQFSGSAAASDLFYALYPYNPQAELRGLSVIKTTLDANQEPTPGTFANGLNINAAISADNTTFVFENVLSVAKFTLNANNLGGKTIKTVKFESSYPLAGDVLITCTAESISAQAGESSVKEITMTSSNGFADGDYYFAVLPNDGGAITMTFESTDGYVARVTATLGNPFRAGYIKNLGTVQGLVWTKVFFYESFKECSGTGGNDGQWGGTIASSNVHTDNEGWVFANEGGAKECVKLGTSSKKGVATTPAVALTGNVNLAFKAGAWNGDSEQLTLSATNANLNKTTISIIRGAFSDYDLTLSNAATNTTITFAGKNASNSRFFLDELLIYVGDKALAYELATGVEVEPTISAPTFDPNGGEFNTAQNVTMTSTTEGATIYYTTDGTDPTTSTTTTVANGGTVTISSSCTLKAIAAKDGVSSAVASAIFTINSGSTYPSSVSFSPSDFEGQGISGSGGDISVVKTPITVFSNKGYCKAGDNHVKVYSGGMIEISASGNKKITKIVLTFSGSNYGAGGLSIPSTQDGDYSESNGTWIYYTGASSVQFNAKAQVRITKIVVTYK